MTDKKEEQKKLITYGMYLNYINEIQHFENTQTYLRMIASTLLLASFVGMGFLFSSELKQIMDYERILGILFICFIGLSSIVALWYLDLIFYERLYIANFVEALKLEKKHSWLTNVHINMIFGDHSNDLPSNVVYYYIGCGTSLIITIGLIFTKFFLNSFFLAPFLIMTLTIIFMMLFYIVLKAKTKDLNKIINNLMSKK